MKKDSQRGFEIIALAWWILAFGVLISVAYTVLVDRQNAMIGNSKTYEPSISNVQAEIQKKHELNNLRQVRPREMTFKHEIKLSRSKRRHFWKKQGSQNRYRSLKERRDSVATDFRSPLK